MWLLLLSALLLGWPVPEPLLIRGFEPPPAPWAAGHRGVDLAAAPGSPITAAGAGRVSFAGTVAGRGVVSIELSGTGRPPLRTTYEPVTARVTRGERVAAGQVVGVLQARPAHCPAPRPSCLHWGLRRGEHYLDPLSLVHRHHPVLLPVPAGAAGPAESASAAEPAARHPASEGAASTTAELTARGAEEDDPLSWPVWLSSAGALTAGALWARRRLLSPARCPPRRPRAAPWPPPPP